MQEEYLEDSDIQYFVEKLDMGEEGGVEYEARYEESFEEVEDDPSNVEYITTVNQKVNNFTNYKKKTLWKNPICFLKRKL